MSRRGFSSTYSPTTLVSSVANTDTTFTVAASTGAPVTVPWTGVVDRGTSNEELVTVTAVSGTTYTVTRATDGQTAKAHASGAAFEHVVSARDFDEPNAHVNDTTLDQHSQYALIKKGLASLIGAAGRVGKLYYKTDSDFLTYDDGTAFHDFPSKAATDAAYVPSGSTGTTTITTNESTTSAGYTDLTTVGPDVTFTAPPSGSVTILFQAQISNANGSGTGQAFMSVEVVKVSDSSVAAAASDTYAAVTAGIPFRGGTAHRPVSGLTPGTSYRARAKYRGDGASCSFLARVVTVNPR